MTIKRFEDLEIWQIAIELAKVIFQISNIHDKFSRDFGFRDQIRRSILSISSNIAEGFESGSNPMFVRYLRIAKGSAGEARSQIYLALEFKYITQEEFDDISEKLKIISSKISKFVTYLESQEAKRKLGQK